MEPTVDLTRVAELPNDLRLHIAKLVFCDMDTRVKGGLIGRLDIPDVLSEKLFNIPRPVVLGKDVFGVKVGQHVIFRGVTDSVFFANACECHDFIKETNSAGRVKNLLVVRGDGSQFGFVQPVSPWFVDVWPFFVALGEL